MERARLEQARWTFRGVTDDKGGAYGLVAD